MDLLDLRMTQVKGWGLHRVSALMLGVCMLGIPEAQAAERSITLAGMSVVVWSGEAGQEATRPVIIFSHGFHGCATQSRFLMEAFASGDYLVFAPNHRDATCRGGEGRWRDRPEMPFRRPEAWSEKSYRSRADDIRRLIGAARADDRLGPGADWSRLGLAGHSLGGYTVLGLAGGWPSWRLSGVKAVLALSPYSQPFVQHDTLAGLAAPVMYQGGTWDLGITPALQKSRGAYDRSPEPKYLVEFDKAGHLAWTDIRRGIHGAIVAYSLAFMNHYVKGEPAGPLLTQAMPGVALLRYASELGSNGAGTGAKGAGPGARGDPLQR